MRRKIITIDEEKCDGCGLCLPACAEGALVLENGKAKLVGDVLCDGLGACLGECPQKAITIEEREAEAFSAVAVARHEVGPPRPARPRFQVVNHQVNADCDGAGCLGARSLALSPAGPGVVGSSRSALSHWPIQLHLISPLAPHYQGRDLLLVADCVPFALPDFHQRFLGGKALCIACPKLDDGQEIYVAKLGQLVEQAKITSLTVITMEVPCCMGLTRLAQEAVFLSRRQVPLRQVVIGVRGEVVSETSPGG